MPCRLVSTDPDFETRFVALLGAKREQSADVDAAVSVAVEDYFLEVGLMMIIMMIKMAECLYLLTPDLKSKF